jgi:hypothetical protein
LVATCAAALVAATSGCGSGGQDATSVPEDPATALERAAERLREESSFRFTLSYTRTRADRPDDAERYAEGEGALDLATGRGRMTFELDLGLPGDESPDVEEPFELRWSRERLHVTWQGKSDSSSRSRARESRALMGVLPDEPEALVDLLAKGREARVAGREALAGMEVVRVRFVVDARAAGRAGVPPELHRLGAAGGLGATLPMETWIAADGLPRVVAYQVSLKPTRILKTRLPSRTIRGEYRLEAFGEPFRG